MSTKLRESIKYQGSLVRPRFAPGILLLDEDLTATVEHTRALSRLLFRSLFGCGVVCGFKVGAEIKCGDLRVTVDAGVALDACGDPIEMCATQTLGKHCAEKWVGKPIWVVIRRAQRDHWCAPRDVVCPSDEEGSPYEATRIKDCFELALVQGDQPPDHPCRCAQPAQSPLAEGAVKDETSAAPEKSEQSESTARIAADPWVEEYDWGCHRGHYCGECPGCGCDGDCGCVGEGWVLLARITIETKDARLETNVEHNVRRFIRPRLAADPLVRKNAKLQERCKQQAAGNQQQH